MEPLTTYTPEETQYLAKILAEFLSPPIAIGMNGTLGAGKTCFTKGLMEGLGVSQDEVSSPTFTIVHEYEGVFPILHIDLYRLEEIDLPNLSLDEKIDECLFDFGGVAVVEWANKHPHLLPAETVLVEIEVIDEQTRQFQVLGSDELIQKINNKWKSR